MARQERQKVGDLALLPRNPCAPLGHSLALAEARSRVPTEASVCGEDGRRGIPESAAALWKACPAGSGLSCQRQLSAVLANLILARSCDWQSRMSVQQN